jgi:hypothetical protein
MKKEQTECSETSAYKIQKQGEPRRKHTALRTRRKFEIKKQFMYICFFPGYSNFATFWIYLLENSRCDYYKNLVTRHEKIAYYSLPLLPKPVSLPVPNIAFVFFFLYVCFSASTLSSRPKTRSSCSRFNSSSAWLPWTNLRHVPKRKWKAIPSKHLFV